MKDNYFDDILKNSMETPRAIPFDESAWERMEQKMPKSATQSTWKTWLKFLPIAVGMLGLLSWNICLQQEINYMQKHPNVIVQTEVAPPTVIHRVDTIYQITEKRITKEAIKNYLEQYVKNSGLSHTNNRFVTPINSSLLKPNSFITSNSNNIFSGSYNPNSLKNKFSNSKRDFFTSNFYNPYFSNLTIPNSSFSDNSDSDLENATLIEAPIDSINQNIFAVTDKIKEESDNIIKSILNDNNTSIEGSKVENADDVAAQENTPKNSLNELSLIPLEELSYYQSLNLSEVLDVPSLYRPNKNTKLKLREQLRFDEFSLGIGNSNAISFNGTADITGGIHAGAYILPNTSVEVELNYLYSDDVFGDNLVFSTGTGATSNFAYPNPYTSPDPNNIPADYQLQTIQLQYHSAQVSLGLKRIWFKDEHIRPFGEIGWLPHKQISGYVHYLYVKTDENGSYGSGIGFPLAPNFNYKWDFSKAYVGGGLSFSLFKNKMDLDLGIRYSQSLKSLNLQNSSALGTFGSLTYNF